MRETSYRLYADFHTHTVYSHGKGTVHQNVQAAQRKGLTTIAISDHGPANLFGVGVDGLHVFSHIRQDIDALKPRYPDMNILLGVEANVISEDGELDIPRSMQDFFDIVLVGLHPLVRWRPWYRGVTLIGENFIGTWTSRRRHARERNTRAIINAVQSNRVDIVTHPGYRLSIDTRALAKACAQKGCALEISGSHQHTTVEYLTIAMREGCRFAIGSDAHTPERVGDFKRGMRLAIQAGVEPQMIVNAC